mmetsp:Transcript_13976/g.31070  ORF Transcript_13976/g.31070 Transcript_13976/m.31070 type:complete len:469 (-) Transcript_13976:615-2021(-)
MSLLTPLRLPPLPRPWAMRGTPNTANIADDRLRQSSEDFFAFKSQLKQLNAALRTHHSDVARSMSSRAEILQFFSAMSVDSPLTNLLSGTGVPTEGFVGSRGSVCSVVLDEGIKEGRIAEEPLQPSQQNTFPTPYQDLYANNARRLANVEQCQREMIDYVAQWDQVVTSRICAELRHVKKLQSTWVQYELKVKALKASVAKKQRKDKESVDLSKVTRNETKLRRAKKEYRNNLICTTILVEEITKRGWKDLVPLVLKMLQNDVDVVKETSSLLGPLLSLQDELKAVCSRFEITEEACLNGRLRLLLEEDATDFARPEDMEDIGTLEAFTVVGTGSVSSNDGAVSAAIHPVDSSSSSPLGFGVGDGDDREEERAAKLDNAAFTRNADSPGEGISQVVLPLSPAALSSTEKQETEGASNEGEDGRRSKNMRGGAYLPTSFYIVYDDNDDGENDDLTTLTPYTRCERRISI